MRGSSLICFVLQFCLISGSLPLFIWSNDRSIEFPRVISGHQIMKNEFSEKYLKKVNNQVVVFVQDGLSVADILAHGGVYGGKSSDYKQLKAVMTEYLATYIPHVENPVESLLKIKNGDKTSKIVSVDAQNVLSSINNIDLNEKSIIVVDLSSIKQNKAKCDEVIGEVISHLKDKCVFTAFLAGRQPEFKFVEVLEKHEKIRHLLSVENVTELPIIDGSFMLKFDALNIGGNNESISSSDLTVVKNECNDFNGSFVPSLINCTVSLKIDHESYKDMVLSFLFATSGPKNPGFWYVKQTTLSYKNNTKEDVIVKMSKGFVDPTPLTFSYSCGKPSALKALKQGNIVVDDVPVLGFTGLQIQVFRDANSTGFGHYNECVGFFTTGIWMFIICAIILLTILSFGITMLLGIDTMDRYDDPKGKTINVAVGD